MTFAVAAPPRRVWRVLHPPAPVGATLPRIIEYPAGSIEILNEGDAAGQGLVRTCVFDVPRYLWSRADGYHQLDEQPYGTTVLTFHKISADNTVNLIDLHDLGLHYPERVEDLPAGELTDERPGGLIRGSR